MRVNFFQKMGIIFRIVMISVKDSSLVVFGSVFAKNKRYYADRIIHSWARHILRILEVEYKILDPHGFEFNPDRPYIIMSNHASHFDIPLIYAAFPRNTIGMISKKELFRIPIFGRGMKLGGCISIDRENRYRAMKDLEAAEKRMLDGVRFWIAPEGGRSRTGKIGDFKKGGFKIALDVKAIIVPVTIIGSGKILPAKTFDFSTKERVEIHIGKPIDTIHYQRKDLQKLMADTASEIALKL